MKIISNQKRSEKKNYFRIKDLLQLTALAQMLSIPGYKTKAFIHQGRSSVILLATRRTDTRPVFIKLLKGPYPPEDAVARLHAEYTALTELKGANGVVRAIDFIEHELRPAIVMADSGGKPLAWIIRHKPMEPSAALEAAAAISRAIAQIHDRQWMHRDINPANIIWNPDTRQAALIDFGIAARFEKDPKPASHPAGTEGTLAYIAPEQTGRVDRPVDWRADLYALGATMYEMLTGTAPFSGKDAMELVHAHIARTPEPPHRKNPDVSKSVSDIVMKLMAKRAENRYQSAHTVARDLEDCLGQLTQTGRIQRLDPGSTEAPARIPMPAKTYGHKHLLRELNRSLARAQKGAGQVVLVTGDEGAGKTALIRSFSAGLPAESLLVARSRADQAPARPCFVVHQAFSGLVKYLLTGSRTVIDAWKNRFSEALGESSAAISEMIPEFELIAGPGQPMPYTGATTERSRLKQIFEQFFRVLAAPEHALVVIIDDMHWIDAASLKLLIHCLQHQQTCHCLVVGSVRTEQDGAPGPGKNLQGYLRHSGIPFKTLHIPPLGTETVAQWLSDVFDTDKPRIRNLARLCMQKAHGNPLYLQQMLQSFFTAGQISFDVYSRQWHWDLEQIRKSGIPGTVAQITAGKIKSLPANARRLLMAGSCIGSRFGLSEVCRLTGLPEGPAIHDIQSATEKGLVIEPQPGTGEYEFAHQRIAAAAYSMLSPQNARQYHLRLARLLKDRMLRSNHPGLMFEAARQYNQAAPAISDPGEKHQAAALNLDAGEQAKTAGDLASALDFFSMGSWLLTTRAWQTDYHLSYRLFLEQAECAYMEGSTGVAETIFDGTLLRHAATDLDRARIYEKKAALYAGAGRNKAALRAGIEGLRILGVRMPKNPGPARLILSFLPVRARYNPSRIAALARQPAMKDPRQMMIMQLLLNMIDSAYFTNQTMMWLIVVRMMRYTLAKGGSEAAPIAFCAYGAILAGMFKRYKRAEAFCELAFELAAGSRHRHHAGRLNGIAATMVLHWRRPYKTVLKMLHRAHRLSMESGDLNFSGMSASWTIWVMTVKGDPLSEIIKQCSAYRPFLARTNNPNLRIMEATRQALGRLCSPASVSGEDFADFAGSRNATLRFWYGLVNLEVSFLLGEDKKSAAHAQQCKKAMAGAVSLPHLPEFFFWEALRIAAVTSRYSGQTPGTGRMRIRKCLRLLKKWATHCPANHQHRYLLVSAELARISGKILEAEDLYEAGINAAQKANAIGHAALGCELAGILHANRHKKRAARIYINEAIYLYGKWGAEAKVRRLKKDHALLIQEDRMDPDAAHAPEPAARTGSAGGGFNGSALDMDSLMKAARTISSEIMTESLLHKMLTIVLENAGAQNGVLLLAKQGQWYIRASSVNGRTRVEDESRVPAGQTDALSMPLVPLAVVHYCANTRQSVVADTPAEDPRFSRDRYFKHSRPAAMLCLPIVRNTEARAMLYLENHLTAGAFSEERINVIRSLGAQFIISMENAALYENLRAAEEKVRRLNQELEKRVASRTAQLEKSLETLQNTQKQLIESEKMAALGDLVAAVAHEINTPVGICVTAASFLDEQIAEMAQAAENRENHPERLDKLTARAAEAVETIGFNLKRAADLITSFKQVAVDQSSQQARTFNLTGYVKEVVASLRPGYERQGHRVTVNGPGDLEIYSYPGALSQVLTNLVINSVTHGFQKPGGQIHLDISAPEDEIIMVYTDNGQGMSPEVAAHVFDPFFTTARSRGGTGLGMHISYNIVTQSLGGSIECASRPGQGAAFTIKFLKSAGGNRLEQPKRNT